MPAILEALLAAGPDVIQTQAETPYKYFSQQWKLQSETAINHKTQNCRKQASVFLMLMEKKIACIFFVRSLVYLLLQKHGVISLCAVQAFVMGKEQLYLKCVASIIMLGVYLCQKCVSVLHLLHKIFTPLKCSVLFTAFCSNKLKQVSPPQVLCVTYV